MSRKTLAQNLLEEESTQCAPWFESSPQLVLDFPERSDIFSKSLKSPDQAATENGTMNRVAAASILPPAGFLCR